MKDSGQGTIRIDGKIMQPLHRESAEKSRACGDLWGTDRGQDLCSQMLQYLTLRNAQLTFVVNHRKNMPGPRRSAHQPVIPVSSDLDFYGICL